MPKRARRPRQQRAAPQSSTPAPRRDSRGLLDRILDTPHLAHVVPRLPPEMLHRVIQTCGLEACGELVALATPGQLARVFDLDLWSPAQPGLDEQFDADRFGLWLEVMMESGAASAARTLAGVDVELATAAFAHHVRVFDPAAVSVPSTDGEEMPDIGETDEGPRIEVGGYLIVGEAHRFVGRPGRRAVGPRRAGSRLLPSGDARLPAPVERRVRSRRSG